MGERLSFWHNLTDTQEMARDAWEGLLDQIKEVGREDILKDPKVLDIGGGMGEFSKYLNSQRVLCVSLDVQDLEVDVSANPVRADAYRMPFADNTFNIVHATGVFDTALYKHDFLKLVQELARVLKQRGLLSTQGLDKLPTQEMEKYFKFLTPDNDFLRLWEKK